MLYIRKNTEQNYKDPYGYSHLLYKVHKPRKFEALVPTRSVCSDSRSITNPIGKWVDIKLQPIAQSMQTYIKDSFEFKKSIQALGTLIPNARLFTFDAVSMYTTISTDYALGIISKYLREKEGRFDYHAKTLIPALEIVMKNHIIKVGNFYRKHISGRATGKPPAPPWAIIYENIHEDEYIPDWIEYVKFVKRFIDDCCWIWNSAADSSNEESKIKSDEFKSVVNNNKDLTWEFTELSNSVNFLDLTLNIESSQVTRTELFEKPLALHLYIPSHSMHPPGVLTSHIFRSVLRIFRLNSDETDILNDTLRFYHNFIKR